MRQHIKVAVPHHNGEVTPCFEYTSGITIYETLGDKVISRTDFALKSKEEFDRVRLLRDQGVSVLICSGIQRAHENLLTASGIQVISWVSGKASEVLRLFLKKKLVAGSLRHGTQQQAGS